MAYEHDMPAAARRLLVAGDRLMADRPEQREVAGYLFGLAAECAVKAIATGIPSLSSDASDRSEFVERWRSLADEYGPLLRPRTAEIVEQPEQFHDPSWDEAQPDEAVLPQETSLHQPLVVLRDDRYERFDPLRRRDLLGEEIYRATFGSLVQRVEEAVAASREDTA